MLTPIMPLGRALCQRDSLSHHCMHSTVCIRLHGRCTAIMRGHVLAVEYRVGSDTMAQILVENLTKTFRVAQRRAGLWGAFAGLVHRTYHDIEALAGIDFAIEESELVGYIGP